MAEINEDMVRLIFYCQADGMCSAAKAARTMADRPIYTAMPGRQVLLILADTLEETAAEHHKEI